MEYDSTNTAFPIPKRRNGKAQAQKYSHALSILSPARVVLHSNFITVVSLNIVRLG